MSTRRKVIRWTTVTVAGLVTILLMAGLLTSSAQSGFSASVSNTNNAVGSGTSSLTATKGGVTHCTSLPVAGVKVTATSTFPCSNETMATSTAATGTTSAAEILTATGTSPFSSASYATTTCGVVKVDNLQDTSNPMVARGPVVFNQAGPTTLSGSQSVKFDGSTTAFTAVTQAANLTNFSFGIWFKTTTAGGGIFGNSTSASNLAGNTHDRMLYMNSSGNLVFSTYSGGARNIVSPATYIDGNWHYAIVTGQSNVTTTTSRLIMYVDGAQVATLSVPAAAVAESTTGYWHIGQAQSTTADGYLGSNQFFTGNLSDFTMSSAVFTAANVTDMYTATTQSAYETRAAAKSPVNLWTLKDTGLTTYAGPFPVLGTTDPCTQVSVTVGTTAGGVSKCLHPVLATACPALTSTYTLATLGSAGSVTLTPSLVGTPVTLTTITARDSDFNTNYDIGLNLLVPLTITENGFTQSFNWAANKTIVN